MAAAKQKDAEDGLGPKRKVKRTVEKAPKGKKGKEEHHGEKSWMFKGYDLEELGLPEEALPYDECQYRGEKGYTVHLPRNAVPLAKSGV